MSALQSTKIDWFEFKRGWRVLGICILGVITSAAVSPLYSFGPFVQPLQSEFGWARGEVQATMTFFFIGLVISSPLAAWEIGKFGLRRTALFSALLLALGYAALTQLNHSVWSLYFAYLLLPTIAAGTQMVLWTQLISLWFVKNRGLALALVLTGTGLCALVVTPLAAYAIEQGGWRTAYLVLGALSLLITIPAVYFWMPHQPPAAVESTESHPAPIRDVQQVLPYRQIIATRYFWLLTFGLAFVVIGILGMITNSIPMMRDRGIPPATAASIFSAVGAALIVGRTLTGYLIDRLWAPGVAFITLMLPALGCLIFGSATTNTGLLVTAAVLIGVGAGAEFDFASFLVARYFGLHNYRRVFSVFYSVTSLFTCITPLFFGRLYDLTGSYHTITWICGICFLVGPTLVLCLGPYPVVETEEGQ